MCCVVIGLEKGHGSTDAAVKSKVENLDDVVRCFVLCYMLFIIINNDDVLWW